LKDEQHRGERKRHFVISLGMWTSTDTPHTLMIRCLNRPGFVGDSVI
jgi:hypothetical protein